MNESFSYRVRKWCREQYGDRWYETNKTKRKYEARRALRESDRRRASGAHEVARVDAPRARNKKRKRGSSNTHTDSGAPSVTTGLENAADHVHADTNEPPTEFCCPITLVIMRNAVVAADGHTYDEEAIKRWFKKRKTSPMTNKAMAHCKLTPNYSLRSMIRKYVEKGL